MRESIIAIIGGCIGLCIAFLVIRFFNKDKKLKSDYDERQEVARGVAYKYAFYAVVICLALMMCLGLGDIELPMEDSVIYAAFVFIGVGVLSVVCIWKEAFIAQNTNTKRYIVVAIIISLVNLINPILYIRAGMFFIDGKLSTPTINLMAAILFLVIGITGIIKKVFAKKEEE